MRREGYQYQEQSPSDHIENLDRYLLVTSLLIPRNPALGRFSIRHPDIQQGNIIVSRSPDPNLHAIRLSDWQQLATHLDPAPVSPCPHTRTPSELRRSCLPIYGAAFTTGEFRRLGRNRAKPREGTLPSPPRPLPLRKNTEECNALHYAAPTDSMGMLRRRLFCHASDPWEGETLALKEATENWETLTGGGAPCPVVFDAEDVREMMELGEGQRGADEACRNTIIGFGPEGWAPTGHYEEATARSKQLKEDTLAEARPGMG